MRPTLTLLMLAGLLAAATYAPPLSATPSSGFVSSPIATGRFEEFELNNHTLPADFWQARLKTKGWL